MRILLLFLLFFVSSGFASAEETAALLPEGSSQLSQPHHSRSRFLVKLTPAAAERVLKVVEDQGILSPQALPIEALRALSRAFLVSSWRPLLAQRREGDSAGLARIFVLTCSPDTDILAAVEAFSALSEWVEYAEPDHSVQIQSRDVL